MTTRDSTTTSAASVHNKVAFNNFFQDNTNSGSCLGSSHQTFSSSLFTLLEYKENNSLAGNTTEMTVEEILNADS